MGGINSGWGNRKRAKSVIAKCKWCNKEFVEYPSRNKRLFCSKICYTRWMIGTTNRVFGRGIRRKPITTSICPGCGGSFNNDKYYKTKYCSRECYGIVRRNQFTGDRSPLWRGGKKNDNGQRERTEYKEWRDKIFKRDNFTCTKCGKMGGILNAHHLKKWYIFPDLRLNINNGVTLCKKCHTLLHSEERRSGVFYEKQLSVYNPKG